MGGEVPCCPWTAEAPYGECLPVANTPPTSPPACWVRALVSGPLPSRLAACLLGASFPPTPHHTRRMVVLPAVCLIPPPTIPEGWLSSLLSASLPPPHTYQKDGCPSCFLPHSPPPPPPHTPYQKDGCPACCVPHPPPPPHTRRMVVQPAVCLIPTPPHHTRRMVVQPAVCLTPTPPHHTRRMVVLLAVCLTPTPHTIPE